MIRGTIQNREGFLKTIANRLGRTEVLEHVDRPTWSRNPQWSVLKNASQDELVEVLKNQCAFVHTTFVEATMTTLADTLRHTVDKYGNKSIVTWNDERQHLFGLSPLFQEEWPQKGIDVHTWDVLVREQNITKAERANIGIVYADLCLAESGTVMLKSAAHRGRTVAFLPENLIVLIRKEDIVPRFTQAAARIHREIENGATVPSCINFITGPSNSADIEMNLVVGVHGPVRATYIVIH